MMLESELYMRDQKRWAQVRNAFKHFSVQDCHTLRKAMVLNNVNNYWELGMIHIAHLELIAKEYSYDWLLGQIYSQMLERFNGFIKDRYVKSQELSVDDIELIFRGQPIAYSDNGGGTNVIYDVSKCSYRFKLIRKYPELEGVINDMVMM